MKKILLSLVAVAALTFASCDAKKEVLDAKTLNGAWNVVELNGASITPSEETPYLDLNFQDNR
ncbi:MAG: META domain-containing protein, partial [Bacteroidales bacterium]